MIEDALKTTRNTERLLLAVSIVALLFVLSVKGTHQEQQLLDELQRLTTLANEDYGEYVEERVAKELVDDPVDFGSDELEAELDGRCQGSCRPKLAYAAARSSLLASSVLGLR